MAATDPLEYSERGDATASPAAAGHPYLGFAIRAAVGVAVIVFLIRKAGGRTIVSLLMRERPAYFATAIALYLAGQMMSAYRWQLLAAIVGIRGRFRQFLAYYFIGVFTNLFLPGMVGGDAARAIYLGREHDRMGHAVASTVADRLIGLMALFWFAATVVWALNGGILPASVTRPVMLLGLAGFAAYLAAPLIARAEHLLPHRLARPMGLVTPYLHRPGCPDCPAGPFTTASNLTDDWSIHTRTRTGAVNSTLCSNALSSDRQHVCEYSGDYRRPGPSRGRLHRTVRNGGSHAGSTRSRSDCSGSQARRWADLRELSRS